MSCCTEVLSTAAAADTLWDLELGLLLVLLAANVVLQVFFVRRAPAGCGRVGGALRTSHRLRGSDVFQYFSTQYYIVTHRLLAALYRSERRSSASAA